MTKALSASDDIPRKQAMAIWKVLQSQSNSIPGEYYHFGRLYVYQFGRMDRKGVGSLRTAENDILIQVIKEARLAAGISQEELSRRMGQSITFIVKIERGTRRIDVYEFVRLAEAIGLELSCLFLSFWTAVQKNRTS